jgi:hypothetical protein
MAMVDDSQSPQQRVSDLAKEKMTAGARFENSLAHH